MKDSPGFALSCAFEGGAALADLWTTELARRNCPTCYEANPLARGSGRYALKAGLLGLGLGNDLYLRKHHEKRWADRIR